MKNSFFYNKVTRLISFSFVILSITPTRAQTSDPIIMTINGQDITKSEFEYSYNKNNAEGVIDKKTVKEYVDLFINYKLKVAAALDEKMDTAISFKKEFTQYRDQQVRPTLINDADVENEAREIYRNTQERIDAGGGLVDVSHILVKVGQKATDAEDQAAKTRIDSIYDALTAGADFAEIAKKTSQDGTAQRGGRLGLIQRGATVKEFEDVMFATEPGQISKPFRSPFGYHIIKVDKKQMFFPYDSVKASIHQFIEQRNIRESIIDKKIEAQVKASDGKITAEDILNQRSDSLTAIDSDMKNLIREYYEGLLLYEISNRNVWEKASKDEEGLEIYFNKNKKKYKWDEPRFKGMVYHVKNAADEAAVKKCVKKLKFSEWVGALRSEFNKDSVIRIRVEKGLFKKGDNAFVDHFAFKKDTTYTSNKDYPIDGTFGKVITKPEEMDDVRGLVVADYQEVLMNQWVAYLRKKYSFIVNEDVVGTVVPN